DPVTWKKLVYTPAAPNLKCPDKAHVTKFLVADYSVAGHLADAVLSDDLTNFPHSAIDPSNNIDLARSMDVIADKPILDFLQVGRLAGDGPSALKLAYKHRFFVDRLNRSGFGAP